MDKETIISELCVSCGMCCDGTLFRRASISDKDDQDRVVFLNLNLEVIDGRSYFSLPCKYFNGKCTIYSEQRANVCGTYFCEPIRELQRGRVTPEEVRILINQAMQVRKRFYQELKKHPEFQGKDIEDIRLTLTKGDQGTECDENDRIHFRQKYGKLLLIGNSLFPKLAQFIQESANSMD